MKLNISNIYKDEENLYLRNQLDRDDKLYSSEVEPSPKLRINNNDYLNNFLTEEDLHRAILTEYL